MQIVDSIKKQINNYKYKKAVKVLKNDNKITKQFEYLQQEIEQLKQENKTLKTSFNFTEINSFDIESFEEQLEKEQQELSNYNPNDLKNDNNFASTFMNTLGIDIVGSYNTNKSHLNTYYFVNRVSDNFILTLQPYLIDRLLKCHILFKNVAEIPVSDALAGLSIQSKDTRIVAELSNINSIITRHLLNIIYATTEAELYGASICVLSGDNKTLKYNFDICKSNNLTITTFNHKECELTNDDIFELKTNQKQINNSTIKINNKEVNKNRCVLLCGSNVAHGRFYKKILRGYSCSIFENLRSALYGIILNIESADEMSMKQSLDILGYKGLAEKLSNPSMIEKIKQSLTGFINFTLKKLKTDDVLVMDADNKYERHPSNFDLSKAIDGIAKEYAFYTGIPVARLLGESGNNLAGTGINANERRYTQLLNKIQQHYYESLHNIINKIIFMLYGIDDIEFNIVFEPQVEMTETEKLDNQVKEITNITSLIQNGVLSIEEAREKLRDMGYLQTS